MAKARLLGILTLGTLLRIAALRQRVWVDEQHVIDFIQGYDLAWLIINIPLRQPHLPLYYAGVELHSWLFSPLSGRVYSVMFGVGTVYLTYKLAKRYNGIRVAQWAALFVALSPTLVLHSGWLRMYALFTFVSLLSLLFYTTRYKAWVTSLTVLVYLHPFGVFVTLVQSVYRLYTDSLRRAAPATLLALPGIAVLALKVFTTWGMTDAMWHGHADLTHITALPTVWDLLALPGALLLGRQFWTVQAFGALLILILCVVGAYRARLLSGYVLSVVGIVIALSVVSPIFQLKYLAFLAPAIAIILSRGLVALPRWQQWAIGSLLCVVQVLVLLSSGFAGPEMGLRVLP